ncbi:MAG: MBL fold metallo-hydrolase [Deltaproteobacteria bacterium]|nr:MAG: MBL fold metallo-hydrolase [Deltaproteobacteria bacterium]
MTDDRLYIRQLRAGRDFGSQSPGAAQMANFVYLVGDSVTRECLVVDPAWDIDGILGAAGEDGYTVTGALVSHYHPDHIGGPLFGHDIEGLAKLLERVDVPIHVHKAEATWVQRVSGLQAGDLVHHDHADVVKVGQVEVECLHTPGHTPGSLCFQCGGALMTGDTLFLQGCGRTDFPGGDPEEMWRTLNQRLKTLPGELRIYGGHDYGQVPSALLSEVRQSNPVLNVPELSTFLRYFT